MPEINVPEYSQWKRIAWRYSRVFVGAFLVVAATSWEQVQEPQDILKVAVIPAAIAGVAAVGKALRTWLAEGNFQSLIHKLPF